MNRFPLFCVLLALLALSGAAPLSPPRLLVRADDMGASHAANFACLRAVNEGIARSIEVMVPGPWYP
ncbi:MAG: ChbG/HpnK family deacetylase, partial [Bacteroidetes bacterium]